MSRLLRYQVAVSLDGFIAGPKGEYDWIVMDPQIDFGALFKEFDTAVMGRKTYQRSRGACLRRGLRRSQTCSQGGAWVWTHWRNCPSSERERGSRAANVATTR